MARPTAVPMIPDSASGVSSTRWSPKSFCRPSVTRKTPPSLPTSSPITMTFGSSSMADRRPVFSALARVVVIGGHHAAPRLVARVGEAGQVVQVLLLLRLAADGAARCRRWRRSAPAAVSASPVQCARNRAASSSASAATCVEEVLIGHTLPGQVRLDPLDRVEQLPVLLLGGHPVAGRVVGGGVRIHPVGEGLDHHRAVAGAAFLQRPPGDGQAGQHVVAVDPDARESRSRSTAPRAAPATAWPPVRRSPTGCSGSRRRPAHRRRRRTPCPRAHRPDWSRRRRRRRSSPRWSPACPAWRRPDRPVEPLAHRVPGGVEHLIADDDRVAVEPGRLGIPAALVGAAEDAEQLGRIDAAAPGDAVLAVGREGHVGGPHRPAGTDLRGLLAEQRYPDAQLALPLQGVALPVEPADQHHVPVQPAQQVGRRPRSGSRRVGVKVPSGESNWIRSSP